MEALYDTGRELLDFTIYGDTCNLRVPVLRMKMKRKNEDFRKEPVK